ncbi:MAG TPA: NADPH-dependent FMN reductase [Oscillatoriaceae cyanobacterium]
MSTPREVAVFVGSLRKESYSRKLALAMMGLAPASLRPAIVEIAHLPMYNQDLDTDSAPASWVALRRRVKEADAVLFVTPEYNRSVPAVLKNALDVASRPYGASAWNGKPGAVVSNSPGAIGGFGANHHLRQSLVFLNVPTMQQPEAYVGHVDKLFGAQGEITVEATRTFLAQFMQAYADWIETLLAGRG